MPENDLRALLNRARWDSGAVGGDVTIVVRVREGGVSSEIVLPFADVGEVLPAGLDLASGTFIPYHRVLAVRRGSTVLWRVRRGDDHEA
jgi:uncharacterized protein (UPF0248 family)